MTDRLKAIEDRARGLGVHVNVSASKRTLQLTFFPDPANDLHVTLHHANNLELHLQAAECLLSLYEDGPVVEVRKYEVATPVLTAGLRPGKYKLVLWEDA